MIVQVMTMTSEGGLELENLECKYRGRLNFKDTVFSGMKTTHNTRTEKDD